MLHKEQGLLKPERYAHNVSINQFVESAERTCTTDLTACIGLVATGGSKVIIGHFAEVSRRDSDGRKGFVNAVYRAAVNESDHFILFGGAPYLNNGIDLTENDRAYAYGYLRAHTSSNNQLEAVWTNAGFAVDLGFDGLKPEGVTLYTHPAIVDELQLSR